MYRFLIGVIGILGLYLAPDTYDQSIRQWQTTRVAKLRSPDSWLALVGLFWLKPGDNTVGSSKNSDILLSQHSVPAHAGVLRLAGNRVIFTPGGGSARILSDDQDHPGVVTIGSVSFYPIKRLDKVGVRVKDSQSPVLKNFHGMEYFPTNPALHVQGKLVPDSKKIPILNVLGQTDREESPGVVEFGYEGKSYHLRPIFEGKTLFFLFKDATNRSRTYQAGRMLNTPLPVKGAVDLDFNHSYNPPCTFTPYATCPLAPKENSLPFAVTAGELRYGKGHAEFAVAP